MLGCWRGRQAGAAAGRIARTARTWGGQRATLPPPAPARATGVLTETTAELAAALTLAAARRVPEADVFMRAGKYEGWLPTLFIGNLLQARTGSRGGAGRPAAARSRAPWGGRGNLPLSPTPISTACKAPSLSSPTIHTHPHLHTRAQNKTIGIIGAGRIGAAYARMMVEGHKMNLVYFDPYPNKGLEDYIRWVLLPGRPSDAV